MYKTPMQSRVGCDGGREIPSVGITFPSSGRMTKMTRLLRCLKSARRVALAPYWLLWCPPHNFNLDIALVGCWRVAVFASDFNFGDVHFF